MFYLTRSPIGIEEFHRKELSDVDQTYFNSLIEDGSDELISVFFVPGAMSGIPRRVEIDFLYYQQTVDIKVVQSMKIRMEDYSEDEFDADGNLNVEY